MQRLDQTDSAYRKVPALCLSGLTSSCRLPDGAGLPVLAGRWCANGVRPDVWWAFLLGGAGPGGAGGPNVTKISPRNKRPVTVHAYKIRRTVVVDVMGGV